TTTPTTTTTTTTLPLASEYKRGAFQCSGERVTDTCGVTGPPQLLYAWMSIDNSFGQNLSGYAFDEGTDFFSDDVTGVATYPFWSMTTSSCEISTLGGRCGAVAFLL